MKKDSADTAPNHCLLSLAASQRSTLLDGLRQMCRLFWGPDHEQCREIAQGTYFSFLERLAPLMDEGPADVLQNLKTQTGRFTSPEALCSHLEEEFVRLFISHKEGIVAPLYQSCYEFENAPLMGASATMMTQRFESKGLSLTDHFHEPPDHLAVEIEYLYFLLEKGWSGRDKPLMEEAVSFASQTMCPWVREFCDRLHEERGPSFYFFAALVLCQVLGLIAASSP